MNFEGIIIGVATLAIIGLGHPMVIKSYYYFGTRVWPAYLAIGIGLLATSLFTASTVAAAILCVAGVTFLWGIKELFEMKGRVAKGMYPENPKRR